MAGKLLKYAGANTEDEAVNMLQRKVATITQTSTTFNLEVLLLGGLFGHGTQGCADRIHTCMPKSAKEVKPEACAQRSNNPAISCIFKLASCGGKEGLKPPKLS